MRDYRSNGVNETISSNFSIAGARECHKNYNFAKFSKCINAIYFVSEPTSTYRMEHNRTQTMAMDLETSDSLTVHALLPNMNRTETYLNVPYGGNN